MAMCSMGCLLVMNPWSFSLVALERAFCVNLVHYHALQMLHGRSLEMRLAPGKERSPSTVFAWFSAHEYSTFKEKVFSDRYF